MKEDVLKVAICDDMVEYRTENRKLIEKYFKRNGIEVSIQEYESGEDFLASEPTSHDLVFMDIIMKEINGMEVAKKLTKEHTKTQFVFVSTSAEFALEAFDVKALHYLLKPVDKDKLYKVLDDFVSSRKPVRKIVVKTGRSMTDVYVDDILYLEKLSNKVIIHTRYEDIVTYMSMAQLEQMLPMDEFVKPIRWAIVAMREITHMPSDVLSISDGRIIDVSRGNKKGVIDKYAQFRFDRVSNRIWK